MRVEGRSLEGRVIDVPERPEHDPDEGERYEQSDSRSKAEPAAPVQSRADHGAAQEPTAHAARDPEQGGAVEGTPPDLGEVAANGGQPLLGG
jgi:hypothetical protein